MASIRSSNYLAPETDSRRRRACAVPAAIADVMAGKRATSLTESGRQSAVKTNVWRRLRRPFSRPTRVALITSPLTGSARWPTDARRSAAMIKLSACRYSQPTFCWLSSTEHLNWRRLRSRSAFSRMLRNSRFFIVSCNWDNDIDRVKWRHCNLWSR